MFDLASLAFKVKVVVCTVSTDLLYLSETIYANKFKTHIQILQFSDGSYEALFPKGQFAEMSKKVREEDFRLDRFSLDESPYQDEDSEEIPPQRRRSLSDSQFDKYFGDHRDRGSKEDRNDSRDSHNSAGRRENSASREREKRQEKNSDHDFKVLMYLDEKNDGDIEEDLEGDQELDHEATKEGKVQVEKKLEFLFRQEVPLNSVYYDEGPSNPPPTATKSQSENIGSFFTPEMGRILSLELSLIKDNQTTASEKSKQVQIEKLPVGFEHMPPGMVNPLIPNNFMYSGFDSGAAFLFPFNVGQMGFQCGAENSPFPIPQLSPHMIDIPKKKPIILDQTQERFSGRLKFFDEVKGYGFIVKDDDEKDIFCHFDDFCKAGINIQALRSVKHGFTLRVSFSCLSYIGRHNKSKKAVDLQFINLTANPALASFSGMPGMGHLSGLMPPHLN